MEAREPVELEGVLGAVEGLAVGHVDVDDAHALDGRGDHAALGVGLVAVQAPLHVLDRQAEAGADAHAVVALLAEDRALVADLFEGLHGEERVLDLGLLHADHVGRGAGEPGGELFHAGADGVDVPGGDAHRSDPTKAGSAKGKRQKRGQARRGPR
jgi:hypothetical protein